MRLFFVCFDIFDMFYKLVRFVRFVCDKIVISNIDFEIVSLDIATKHKEPALFADKSGSLFYPKAAVIICQSHIDVSVAESLLRSERNVIVSAHIKQTYVTSQRLKRTFKRAMSAPTPYTTQPYGSAYAPRLRSFTPTWIYTVGISTDVSKLD